MPNCRVEDLCSQHLHSSISSHLVRQRQQADLPVEPFLKYSHVLNHNWDEHIESSKGKTKQTFVDEEDDDMEYLEEDEDAMDEEE